VDESTLMRAALSRTLSHTSPWATPRGTRPRSERFRLAPSQLGIRVMGRSGEAR
jgi:hypothetical protein